MLNLESGDAEPPEGPLRVSLRADGLTEIDDNEPGEKPDLYGFASLDGDGRYVGWTWLDDDSGKPDAEVLYILMERDGTGFRFIFPNCSDNAKALAVAAGAVLHEDKKAAVCRFGDRPAFESAIAALAGLKLPTIRLQPISAQVVP